MKSNRANPIVGRPMADEPELVRRAQRGDRSAYEDLVRRCRAKLVHWLGQRTACLADAEDVAQQALLRAFENLDRHDGRRPFSAWLYRIAHRIALDHARKSRPRPGLDGDALADPRHAGPEQAAVACELRENLWATAQDVLSAEQYSALWLRYAEDMPIQDVARVLSRTRISARVLLHRARQRLAPHVLAWAEPSTMDSVADAMTAAGPPRSSICRSGDVP